ncbi:hypothetical protein RJ639_031594 [Escallonia herrerae]|uniref:Secreted protein n=1 Tax=Escallonia herrerae TaxID=1293975 RepID=A0AA89BCQ5_9ASTE|nr:hypothetical protein RJ639_031594 [Escallonia herrerae]
MVFNGVLVVAVAKASAQLWQHVACFPDRVSSDELLDLVCCLPLQQLGRLALCIWAFFCVPPPPDSYYSYSYDYDSDSDSDSSSLSDFHRNDEVSYYSHSD